MADFPNMSQSPPEETQQAETTTEEVKEQSQGQTTQTEASTETTTEEKPQSEATEERILGQTTTEGTEQSEQPAETEGGPAEVDKFIETFNKRFNTTYENEDAIKDLFDRSGKVGEYEEKLKEFDSLKSSVDTYKEQLEEVRANGLSDLMGKPLIRGAYIADQLLAKYPDKDPFILQEVAMLDLNKMTDLEVLAREAKINNPNLNLEDIKQVILDDIKPETPVEDWTSTDKTKLAVRAGNARANLKSLLQGIDVPKTVTKEEREAAAQQALEDKKKAAQPFKEVFTKFDTYENEDFSFTVPDEYKNGLGQTFDDVFIEAGVEINKDNIGLLEAFKRGLFLDEYFPQIKAVIEKQAKASVQEKTDEELDNTEPPNTATAAEQPTTEEKLPGIGDFFQTNKRR